MTTKQFLEIIIWVLSVLNCSSLQVDYYFVDQKRVPGQWFIAEHSTAWVELAFAQLAVKAKQKASRISLDYFVNWNYFLYKMPDKECRGKASTDFSRAESIPEW